MAGESVGSSMASTRGSTGERGWDRPGLTRRGERVLDVAGVVLLALFVLGWSYAFETVRARDTRISNIAEGALTPGRMLASAMTNHDAPTAAYLTGAALDVVMQRMLASQRGISGKLRVRIDTSAAPVRPDTLPVGGKLRYSSSVPGEGGDGSTASTPLASAPAGAGLWHLVLVIGNAIRPISNFSIITEVPFSAKKQGHIGLYYIGSWPGERGGRLKTPAYANPSGFIEVTPQNADTYVSVHFKLRDFLTHDQPTVWPKYIVLSPKLVDKLELVLSDLQEHGVDVQGVHVMSGFRTPQYNATGGDPTGRAAVSRHMYGDAADIYIDNNRDGQMDDLNHDGRIDINDSRVILAALERVEAAHPELVGGAGVYVASDGHGPFIHIDTRGYRARWVGTGGG